MGKHSSYLIIPTIACFMFFLSCKKEKSCEGCINGNKPPTAVAGPDQVITLPTDSVSLDGSSSSDPDGTISSWLWTPQTITGIGPAISLRNNPSTNYFELTFSQ